jgi:hypothetical protein
MTANDFIQQANNSPLINAFNEFPQVKNDVRKFANKRRVKALLYMAGTRILNLLLSILEYQIIKKYGTRN